MNLHEVRVRLVERSEEPLHRQLMAAHHYLGYLPKIGHTLWYVATYCEQWVDDLTLFFQDRQAPHFVTHDSPDHGRIETRKIWTTTALNSYLDFPPVAQAFAIERIAIDKKTGQSSREMAYGITSRPPAQTECPTPA